MLESLEARQALATVDYQFDANHVGNITVDGRSILGHSVGTNGMYLVGSVDGSDNSGKGVTSVGGSGGLMKPDNPSIPRPPFKMSFTEVGNVLNYTVELGPMPAKFETMSLPFDFSKPLTDSFSFNGNSYVVSSSTQNGPRLGNGATYDSIVPAAAIPNSTAIVGVATVNGAISWGEVSGPLATVRVIVQSSSHYQSLKFYNHSGTDNLELHFGRMNKGETARVSGQIIVTPKVAPPFALVLQAESSSFAHQTGRREGDGWSARVGDVANRYLAYGPYTTAVPAGNRTATFRLQLDNVTADNNRILTIDVYDATTGTVLARRELRRRDFSHAGQYKEFELNFRATAGRQLEFRTYWHGGSYAKLDRVSVR